MARGLNVAPPKRKAEEKAPTGSETGTANSPATGEKFTQVSGQTIVQFNRKVPQEVADGYEMLRLKTKRKVPDLLAEGLALLEEKYGKI
jgi:hypothetical protein